LFFEAWSFFVVGMLSCLAVDAALLSQFERISLSLELAEKSELML